MVRPPRLAPDFSLVDYQGKRHRLSEYRGNVMIVNFWATWCPPCRMEMPSLEKFHASMKGRPFGVLALDQSESATSVFEFLAEVNPAPTFPLLLDSQSATSRAFGVTGLPTSFLIDRRGEIVGKAIGGRDFTSPGIRHIVESLMSGPR